MRNEINVDDQYLVQLVTHSHHVDFTVFEIEGYAVTDDEEEKRQSFELFEVLKGFTKWDGCSNVTSDSYIHFCHPQDFITLGKTLQITYNEIANHFNSVNDFKIQVWE